MDTYSQYFKRYKNALVALSGGADSAVLLRLAAEHMGRENILAATCVNSHFFSSETANAKKIAEMVGVGHVYFTAEMPKEFYAASPDRCYHCKKAIIQALQEGKGFDIVFDGTNADDDTQERRGYQALQELGVASPLLELNLGKSYIQSRVHEFAGIVFKDESCKATRLDGEIDDFRMSQVEEFEQHFKDKFPNIRYRIDRGFVEFKSPVKMYKEDFATVSKAKRKLATPY